MKLGGRFSESDYQKEQTRILLDLHGQYIKLHREPEWVDDGAGGVIREGGSPTLGEQRFWFFEAAPIAHVARGTNFQETIGMGQRAVTSYVIVGMPEANVRQGDTFSVPGDDYTYRVEFVNPDRSFQTIGEVTRITHPQGDEDTEEDDEDADA